MLEYLGDYIWRSTVEVGAGLGKWLAVLAARIVRPFALIALVGGAGMTVNFALMGRWASVATGVAMVIVTGGIYLAARAILRAWWSPRDRTVVRYYSSDRVY